MVVVCPPPSMFMTPRPSTDCFVVVSDCSGGGSSRSAPCYDYVLLEDPGSSLLIAATSGDLIIEIEDDDDESRLIAAGAAEDDEPCWDPLQHIDELPRRPMSRFRKACIDVAFVAFTVAAEAGLVRAALHDGLVTLLIMLPFMLGSLYLAVRSRPNYHA